MQISDNVLKPHYKQKAQNSLKEVTDLYQKSFSHMADALDVHPSAAANYYRDKREIGLEAYKSYLRGLVENAFPKHIETRVISDLDVAFQLPGKIITDGVQAHKQALNYYGIPANSSDEAETVASVLDLPLLILKRARHNPDYHFIEPELTSGQHLYFFFLAVTWNNVSFEVIKVGRSNSPRVRLQRELYDLSRYDVLVHSSSIARQYPHFGKHEIICHERLRALKELTKKKVQWTPGRKREYFYAEEVVLREVGAIFEQLNVLRASSVNPQSALDTN